MTDVLAYLQSYLQSLTLIEQRVLLVGAWVLSMGVVGFVVYRWQARKRAQWFEEGLQNAAQQHLDEMHVVHAEIGDLQAQLQLAQQDKAALEAERELLAQQRSALTGELEEVRQALAKVGAEHAAAEARFTEAQKGFTQREQLLRETSEQLKKEFEVLANRVFENQGERHQARLQSVLTPFKDQIVDFRKRVEEVYRTDTKERASLLTEIKNLQQASDRINEEAENLTKALKGDKKLQGNWGELVLERILEESGLRKDHEYFVQSARRDHSGDLKRPDVLIRLPEDKDVVVDSKVTLNAYEEALAATEDGVREQLLKQHVLNIRGHVKRLSEQNYDSLPDVRSLDFVLMFVPIESAFTLAMELDPKLFTEAFNQRIVVVSPTTLLMTLRIINNVWRYEKQNRNAQEIAKRAGALVRQAALPSGRNGYPRQAAQHGRENLSVGLRQTNDRPR